MALKNNIPSYLLQPSADRQPVYGKCSRVSSAFLDRGLLGLSRVVKDTYVQWDLSSRNGLFQRLDPRLKLLFLVFFAVAINLKKDLVPEFLVAAILLALCILSGLHLMSLYGRVVVFTFIFGVLLSLPSAFNVILPGTVVLPLARLDRSYDFLFYHVPQMIGVTREGLHHASLLSLRVFNSLTVCLLVLYTTPFPDLSKALGLLRVSDLFIMIITLFHKYLFILARSLEEMHLAMKSRLVSSVGRRDARVWATGRMLCVYRKSQQNCEEVFKAMASRGFTGEVSLDGAHRYRGIDWLAGAALFAVWMVIVLM